MSNATNDNLAESLFERLEAMAEFMNLHEYGDKQADLLRLIVANDYDEAQELVLAVEAEYNIVAGMARQESSVELEGEYSDVY